MYLQLPLNWKFRQDLGPIENLLCKFGEVQFAGQVLREKQIQDVSPKYIESRATEKCEGSEMELQIKGSTFVAPSWQG